MFEDYIQCGITYDKKTRTNIIYDKKTGTFIIKSYSKDPIHISEDGVIVVCVGNTLLYEHPLYSSVIELRDLYNI